MKLLKFLKVSWHGLWSLLLCLATMPLGVAAVPFLWLIMWWDEQKKYWITVPNRKPDKFDEKLVANNSLRSIIESQDIDVKVTKKPTVKAKGRRLNVVNSTFQHNWNGLFALQEFLREMRSWGLGRVYLYDVTINKPEKTNPFIPTFTVKWAYHRDIGSKPSTRDSCTV